MMTKYKLVIKWEDDNLVQGIKLNKLYFITNINIFDLNEPTKQFDNLD